MAVEKMQGQDSRCLVRSQASMAGRMKLKGGRKVDVEFWTSRRD